MIYPSSSNYEPEIVICCAVVTLCKSILVLQVFISLGGMWTVKICAPQLNEDHKMFTPPDGLRKATGKTLEGPAVAKAQPSLRGGHAETNREFTKIQKKRNRREIYAV